MAEPRGTPAFRVVAADRKEAQQAWKVVSPTGVIHSFCYTFEEAMGDFKRIEALEHRGRAYKPLE